MDFDVDDFFNSFQKPEDQQKPPEPKIEMEQKKEESKAV